MSDSIVPQISCLTPFFAQHDGRRYQVWAADPIALLLETAVEDFAQPVDEQCTGQRA